MILLYSYPITSIFLCAAFDLIAVWATEDATLSAHDINTRTRIIVSTLTERHIRQNADDLSYHAGMITTSIDTCIIINYQVVFTMIGPCLGTT